MYHYELERLGIDLRGRFKGRIKTVCPVCAERKGGTKDKDLSVFIDEGLYKCHSTSCDFQGRAHTKTYEKPEYNPNRTDLPTRIVRYLEGRGISQKTLRDMKVTVSDKGSLTFNYFRNGDLVNTKSRWTTKDGKKAFSQHVGAEKILYNVDSLKGKEKCIVVEGEIDVLSWIETGVGESYGIVSVDQGAPSPGQDVHTKLDCLKNCAAELDQIKEFYLATDKDAPGQYLEQLLIRRLGEYRCKRVEFPPGLKDANDVLLNQGYDKSVNAQLLRECLKAAKSVPVPGIQVLDQSQREVMLDGFREGKRKGETTHYPYLDQNFTFYPGDLTVVTGVPMSGKGQCMRTLMVAKAKFADWKWACYVPEDFPAEDFWDEIIHTYVGKTPEIGKDQMSEAEYHRGMDFAKEHFFLIHPEEDEAGQTKLPSNEWINEQIRHLRLRFGVNAYIKDPWNKIYHDMRPGEREDQYLARELSKEKFFAKLFDAAIYIAHPKQMSVAKDGEIQEPNAYSISGGSMWNNMADNIIVVHRPNVHRNDGDLITTFRSIKIKKQKRVGRPGKADLWFNHQSNRYFQSPNDYSPLEELAVKSMPEPEPAVEFTPEEDLPF